MCIRDRNHTVDGSFLYESISPIPITEEILDKIDWNGYIKLRINSYFSIDNVGHLFYHNDYTGINISYIHQLQNLVFSLTGTELNLTITHNQNK